MSVHHSHFHPSVLLSSRSSVHGWDLVVSYPKAPRPPQTQGFDSCMPSYVCFLTYFLTVKILCAAIKSRGNLEDNFLGPQRHMMLISLLVCATTYLLKSLRDILFSHMSFFCKQTKNAFLLYMYMCPCTCLHGPT